MEHATGRDLERFFYDWVERPGSPDLDITTEYLPDSQQARVVVKQTQAGEPFHIPLKLVFHCPGAAAPTVVEQEMTEKELTLRVPLSEPLARLDVDPDQAVLAEIKETKPRDLWRAQLLQAPDVPARIRAARHIAASKSDADRELLARAFAEEKFWAIKVELASALGTAGGAGCRDALLQGLHHADARVRKACVESLGKFPREATVTTVLKETLQKGDPSYAVEGAALTAYARQGQPDAAAVITPWLSKPSHDDVLRGSALVALGATQDPAALETLLSWTQPGKPRNSRTAALRALTEAARSKKLTDAQRQKVLKALTAALETDDRFLRFNVLSALPDLGPLAQSALPAVDKIAQDESEGRMREMAKNIADRIRANAKGSAAPASTELAQLREEVKRLQSEQNKLRERLDRYEKAGRK
jgi:aminopeptidase N